MIFHETEQVELKEIFVPEIKKEVVAFANSDGENLMRRVCAVLNILRIIQVLQNTLAEGDAVLLDIYIRCCIGSEVKHLKVNIGKIDRHFNSFRLDHRQARLYC